MTTATTEGVFAFDLDSKRAERWTAMVRERSGDQSVDWGYCGGRASLCGTDVEAVAQACEALLPELFALQRERRVADFPELEDREQGWFHWDPDALPFVSAKWQAGRLIGKSFERGYTLKKIGEAMQRIARMDDGIPEASCAPILRDFAVYLRDIADDLLEKSAKVDAPVPRDDCRRLRHSTLMRHGKCSRCGGDYDAEPLL